MHAAWWVLCEDPKKLVVFRAALPLYHTANATAVLPREVRAWQAKRDGKIMPLCVKTLEN